MSSVQSGPSSTRASGPTGSGSLWVTKAWNVRRNMSAFVSRKHFQTFSPRSCHTAPRVRWVHVCKSQPEHQRALVCSCGQRFWLWTKVWFSCVSLRHFFFFHMFLWFSEEQSESFQKFQNFYWQINKNVFLEAVPVSYVLMCSDYLAMQCKVKYVLL